MEIQIKGLRKLASDGKIIKALDDVDLTIGQYHFHLAGAFRLRQDNASALYCGPGDSG